MRANAYYAGAVATAAKAGVIQGRGADTFAPDDKISREEMAALIVRAYELKLGKIEAPDEHRYNDNAEISGWALEAVNKAFAAGFMTGTGNGDFAPDQAVSRAEAAAGLARLLDGLLR